MQANFLKMVDKPPVSEVNGLYPAKCLDCGAYIKVCNWIDINQQCFHCQSWGDKHKMVRLAISEGAEIAELYTEVNLPWDKHDPFIRQQYYVVLVGEVVSHLAEWETIL